MTCPPLRRPAPTPETTLETTPVCTPPLPPLFTPLVTPTFTPLLPALVSALLLAACAATPETRWHSLLPGPVTATAAAAAAAAVPVPAQLVAVRVPLAVDQPQWLVRLPDQSLRVLEQERWTSPLRDELRAALHEHLQREWGLQPPAAWGLQPPASGAGAAPAWRIEVEVQRFESLPGQAAWLGGRYTVAAAPATGQTAGAGLACGFSLQQPVAPGPLALAEGHRLALARLAAQIGQGLQALATGRPAGCAAP